MQDITYPFDDAHADEQKRRIDREISKIYPDVAIDSKFWLIINPDFYFPVNSPQLSPQWLRSRGFSKLLELTNSH